MDIKCGLSNAFETFPFHPGGGGVRCKVEKISQARYDRQHKSQLQVVVIKHGFCGIKIVVGLDSKNNSIAVTAIIKINRFNI